jgi:stage III sporulation protein AE
VLFLFLLILLTFPAQAAPDFERDVRSAEWNLPAEAREGTRGVISGAEVDLGQAGRNLWNRVAGAFREARASILRELLLIAGIFLVCALASGLEEAGKLPFPVVNIAGALGIYGAAIVSFRGLAAVGAQALRTLESAAIALLATMGTLGTAAGYPASTLVRQTAAVFFSGLMISLMARVFVPVLFLYMTLCVADAALDNAALTRIAKFIRNTVGGVLAAGLTLYIAYITIAGQLAGSADALALKSMRLALSGVLPVVGGIVSDAAETVLLSAGVMKNAFGAVGMVAILAVCVGPFVQMGARYLGFKLLAAAVSPLGEEKLVKLMDALSDAFGLLLGMVGTAGLALIIALMQMV